MDMDNIQQNLNTRVVFKEPRGMIRWVQLLFALIALYTIVNFETNVGVQMDCATKIVVNGTVTNDYQHNNKTLSLNVSYPFDFAGQTLTSTCINSSLQYKHPYGLNGSPEFIIMTASLSLIFGIGSLVIYLLFSNIYHSIPILPVVDLITTALLALFWLISSFSFSFGVQLMKYTINFQALNQTLCQSPYPKPDDITLTCTPNPEFASWSSLDIGIIAGFTSFFIWLGGIWFVYKETHFHTAPEQQFGP